MWATLASDMVKYERGQSIHWPSRRDCSVWMRGEAEDPLPARAREGLEPHRLDGALVGQAQRALHLHLDPQALAVEPVLVALVEPAHGLVALDDVLVGAAARVMDAHGVVGGDRPVEEREPGPAAVGGHEAVEDAVAVPLGERLASDGDEVERSWSLEHVRLPVCAAVPGSGDGRPREEANSTTAAREP